MLDISLVNFYQLKASSVDMAKYYAFYLYKSGVIQEKQKYSRSPHTSFNLTEPGSYRIKCFRKHENGSIESQLSEPFRFDGFRDFGIEKPKRKVAIVGVSRTSAFAAHVFEVRHQVDYFIDPTGDLTGGTFFGRPILSSVPNGQEARLIGHERHLNAFPTMEAFTLTSGAQDALSQELHRHGAIELYRISHRTHLAGLSSGSIHIREFIFNKYNCRIPFEAVLGEGTRLGYGGIGTVIHPDSVVGKNCIIAQNVTLGSRAGGNGTPIIGDNVWISPGAKCFGGKIGNNVIVGANAVVLKEIPDNSVVAGVPAKIISTNIDKYSGYFQKLSPQ